MCKILKTCGVNLSFARSLTPFGGGGSIGAIAGGLVGGAVGGPVGANWFSSWWRDRIMQFPDNSIFLQHAQGDSGFENVYIYGKLNYDFKNDDIVVKSINVTSPSVFSGDVAFSGDITLDEITCRNADVTGIATVRTDLYVGGNFYDASGDVGNSGQLLSSTGSGTNWIDANTTSVANSINVGTNLNSTNADQFVTFVGSSVVIIQFVLILI